MIHLTFYSFTILFKIEFTAILFSLYPKNVSYILKDGRFHSELFFVLNIGSNNSHRKIVVLLIEKNGITLNNSIATGYVPQVKAFLTIVFFLQNCTDILQPKKKFAICFK